MTIFGVGLFTLAFGRLFCGWACPQTVFMEGVFRRLDRLIEGSPEQQRKRDEGPWTWDKTSKKILKHGSYLVLAFVIGNVFLMYFIGRDGLWQIITDDPRQHLGGLSAMLAFTGLTWFNFAKFRVERSEIKAMAEVRTEELKEQKSVLEEANQKYAEEYKALHAVRNTEKPKEMW
jgi:polyferredoxin